MSIIYWVSKLTGAYGYGKPTDSNTAIACASEMNSKYPYIDHKVINNYRELQKELERAGVKIVKAYDLAVKAFNQ